MAGCVHKREGCVEFNLDGSATRRRLTEQLAYLDGRYDLDERIPKTGTYIPENDRFERPPAHYRPN
ncbi:hypothetical protein SAMN05216428_104179 [Nitrosospira sp. Nsp11]|nr:hypothetical protein SAMN05216315_1076 [Nitrosospira sp. Nsp18]SHL64782.1 hypothetical protein SAMN05216428_104179 [Nitrosospira sp. Nsp11]